MTITVTQQKRKPERRRRGVVRIACNGKKPYREPPHGRKPGIPAWQFPRRRQG